MNDYQPVNVDDIFNKVHLRSWFEERNGVSIGMGSATTYDRHGNMISHKVEPTGIRMVWDKPVQKKSIPALWCDKFLNPFAKGMNERLNERIKSMEIKDQLKQMILQDEPSGVIADRILAKFNLTPKPPSLLDQIEEAKVKCMIQNIKPTSLYLGKEEVPR